MTEWREKYVRLMPVAQAFASLSKDPSTKVGCVIVGPDYEVRASGWNGAPRGSNADEDHRFQERAEKLHWVCHAEANAVANAARTGTSLKGCVALITMPPCMSCAKLLVQAGVKHVFAKDPNPEFAHRWSDELKRSYQLFEECGVDYREYP